jgi:hypothetical protein
MSDSPSAFSKFHCRHCSGLNLIPSQPVQDTKAIIDATIRHVIGELLLDARDPERIGRRVLTIDFALRQEKAKLKQLDLAHELGVSPPTVNVSLVRTKELLSRLRKANVQQKSSNGEAHGSYF